jgi:hypothetical protein
MKFMLDLLVSDSNHTAPDLPVVNATTSNETVICLRQ